MKRSLAVLSVFWLLYSLRANVWGQSVRAIEILDYGIYTAKILTKKPAEKTATGDWNVIETAGIVKRTTDIPASLGTRFGILYVVKGEPTGQIVNLQKITIHPGLKNPEKKEFVYKSNYLIEAEIGIPRHSGYGFDHEWEVVPGKWTIELWYKGRKLAEKTFAVRSRS
jgi:hypothetical protein